VIGFLIIVAVLVAAYLDLRRLRYQRITRQWTRMDLARTRANMKQHYKSKR
jgi:hypothetical protein